MNGRTWLVLGAILAGLAVAIGAIGSHRLPGLLEQIFVEPAALTKAKLRIPNWEIAARYQMYHGLALFGIGLLLSLRPSRLASAAAFTMFFGVLIFSGCLYAYVLTGFTPLGKIVPIGGVLQIIGWVLLTLACWRVPAEGSSSAIRP